MEKTQTWGFKPLSQDIKERYALAIRNLLEAKKLITSEEIKIRKKETFFRYTSQAVQKK